MAVATPVSICSNALQALGADPIADFEEATENARRSANLWPSARDAALRSHNWRCATARALLAPMADIPAFDFAHQFALPSDWIRNIQVGGKRNPIAFRLEGRRILADVTSLPLVYVFRNENPATWDTALIELAETIMQAKLAYPVTASTSLRDSLNQQVEYMRRVARSIDGQDDPPEELEGSPSLEARFAG